MSYFIGIDGGGTKTKCILTNGNKKILYECRGGPSNFLSIGTNAVSETLTKLIQECLNHLELSSSDITSVVLGATGAGRETDALKMEKDFLNFSKKAYLNIKKINVVSDARIALEGAFSGGPGSILIAGTGSIMFGKDNLGNILRVGGVGRILGDEGSGYSIGRRGLNAFAKEFDGREKKTILTEILKSKFDISNQTDLINKVYKDNFDIASVTPYVISAAEENDEVCLDILHKESGELLKHVQAMKQKLNLTNLKLSLLGGLLTSDNFYSKLFKDKLNDVYKDVTVYEPDFSPEMGAVILAEKYSSK